MNIRKLLTGLLFLMLFCGLSFANFAEAKQPFRADLIFTEAQPEVPSDEITKKYGFTLADELVIGRSVSYALLQKYDSKINTDPALNEYVNLVGQSVAKASSNRPQVDYKFGIIDTDEINAFATPGGYVFITTGLLKILSNENELAGVLAHEIGHIEHGDGLRDVRTHNASAYAKADIDNISNNAAVVADIAESTPYLGSYVSYYSPKSIAKRQIGRAIGHVPGGYYARSAAYSATDLAVDSAVSGLGKLAKKIGTVFIKRQYEDPLDGTIEIEADKYSAEALAKTGYDPEGIAEFLKMMQFIQMQTGDSQAGNASSSQNAVQNVFTYRHPPIPERISKIDETVATLNPVNPGAKSDETLKSRFKGKIISLK